MSEVNVNLSETTINVDVNNTVNDINIIIDDSSPNVAELYTTLNLLRTLSSKFVETSVEMDTLQDTLSAGWEETYQFIDTGIVDAGFF